MKEADLYDVSQTLLSYLILANVTLEVCYNRKCQTDQFMKRSGDDKLFSVVSLIKSNFFTGDKAGNQPSLR